MVCPSQQETTSSLSANLVKQPQIAAKYWSRPNGHSKQWPMFRFALSRARPEIAVASTKSPFWLQLLGSQWQWRQRCWKCLSLPPIVNPFQKRSDRQSVACWKQPQCFISVVARLLFVAMSQSETKRISCQCESRWCLTHHRPDRREFYRYHGRSPSSQPQGTSSNLLGYPSQW